MYLDARPKKLLVDLFGREDEIIRLKKAIEGKNPLVVISGLRRVGKTSLLGVVLNEMFQYHILIDPRDLGPTSEMNKKDIMKLFQNSIQAFLNSHRDKAGAIVEFLKHVRGFSVSGFGIQFDADTEIDLSGLFSGLDKWAGINETSVIVAIDEAQDFAKSTEFALDALLAGIYDKCSNIILVLTGSEMGLLYNFLGDKDSAKPLYGRTREDIKLKPLTEKQSKQFLIEGFKQKEVDVQKDATAIAVVDNAVKKLDGVIGWLIKFAKKCLSNNKIDEEYILETQKEGSAQARQEFIKFAKLHDKDQVYQTIMKELQRLQTTSQIEFVENYAENNSTKKEVQELLTEQYIIKIDEKYFFGDPLLQFSFEQEANQT